MPARGGCLGLSPHSRVLHRQFGLHDRRKGSRRHPGRRTPGFFQPLTKNHSNAIVGSILTGAFSQTKHRQADGTSRHREEIPRCHTPCRNSSACLSRILTIFSQVACPETSLMAKPKGQPSLLPAPRLAKRLRRRSTSL